MGKFVIRSVPTGVKFDLYAQNGQTVLSSEVYRTAAACRKGVESVLRNAPYAKIEDQTREGAPPQRSPKFQVYLDKGKSYRFRLRARNGLIIAVSEPYTSKAGCLAGIASVKESLQKASLEEVLVKTL